ncbi:MAG: MFS transporter [Saprospiraceae bacterium]|nr:MFS transporter [Saprospiraceae bacterium]
MRTFALHSASLTIGISFFSLSLLMGTWVARIPDVQARTGLTDGQLGISMLGLSFGALIGTSLSGWILSKLSTGRAAALSAVFFGAAIVLPAFAFNQWSLMAALALVGATNGFMSVSINAAAAAIEKSFRISIMSACHGMFSLGGMIGAASSGWVASLDISLQWHFTLIAFLMVLAQIALRPILLSLPNNESSGPRFVLPRKALLGLAIICFCIILCEGAVADWSAVYLKNNLESSSFIAGLGYAGFCLTMAIGRFSGDAIRSRFGANTTIRTGSLIAVTGLLLLIATTSPIAGVLCFVLIGAGLSTIVPTIYGASAKVPGIPAGTGLASVATAGIVGMLTGRLLIGNISDLYGLNIALALMAVLLVAAAGMASKVKV